MPQEVAQPAPKRLAILPWGDLFEDYLDTVGLSLDEMCRVMTGGWLFGYVAALQAAGVECVLFVVSARLERTRTFRHEPTGALVRALPCSPVYRALRRVIADPYAPTGRAMFAAVKPWQRLPAKLARPLVPYFNTPLVGLGRELRRQGCTAILCQEYEYARFDLAVLLGTILNLPVFASFQGGSRPFSGLERRVRRWSLQRAAGLVIGARREVERVRTAYRVPADKIAVIPNALDVDFWSAEDRAAARAALDLPADRRIVVWHGRVNIHQKGLDLLLDAWKSLVSADTAAAVTLLLVGDGPDAERLRARLDTLGDELGDALGDASGAGPGDGRIVWIDRYLNDRPLIRRYLSAADLYVLPSRHEGFAVAPLEAMACGLPIVAADVPGIADVLPRGADSGGVIVPPEDAEALAAALGRLIAAPHELCALGKRAREEVERRFSLASVGRELEAFLFGPRRTGREGPEPGP